MTQADYTNQRTELMAQAAQALEQKAERHGRQGKTIEAAIRARRAPARQLDTCHTCNEALNPGANFCPHCSAQTAVTCVNCQQPLTQADNFCSRCGTVVQAPATA